MVYLPLQPKKEHDIPWIKTRISDQWLVQWSSSTAGINLSSAAAREKGLVIKHIGFVEIEKNQQLKKWFDYFWIIQKPCMVYILNHI